MNFIQRATLGIVGGLNLNVKKVGNQVPLVDSYRDGLPILQEYTTKNALEKDIQRTKSRTVWSCSRHSSCVEAER